MIQKETILATISEGRLRERKRIKKKMKRHFPDHEIGWFHGRLCDFGSTKNYSGGYEPVTILDAPILPKENGEQLNREETEDMLFAVSRRKIADKRTSRRPANSSVIVYSELEPAADNDGECNECAKYPNLMVLAETDIGQKYIVHCRKCGHIMKPHPDQKD